mmetsp:Transcript_23571/g.49877  ORF Transcript_23571/g.49877 Transcript_23571/m.49877 type:complete len:227 (+) Transcript_23571:3505-4185(+)
MVRHNRPRRCAIPSMIALGHPPRSLIGRHGMHRGQYSRRTHTFDAEEEERRRYREDAQRREEGKRPVVGTGEECPGGTKTNQEQNEGEDEGQDGEVDEGPTDGLALAEHLGHCIVLPPLPSIVVIICFVTITKGIILRLFLPEKGIQRSFHQHKHAHAVREQQHFLGMMLERGPSRRKQWSSLFRRIAALDRGLTAGGFGGVGSARRARAGRGRRAVGRRHRGAFG